MSILGRPVEYDEETVIAKGRAYLDSCVDEIEEYHKTRGEKSDGYERLVRVKLPTIEGLALAIGIHKDTIYDWEKKYPTFSDLTNDLRAKQADALINNGLSGDYNPLLSKLLLSKHGYKEATETDVTSGGKALPTPILNVLCDNGDKESIKAD
jgi:hypothetical protein